jgi:hypothetical protein
MDRCIYITSAWSENQKVELSQTDEKPEYKVEEIKVFAMLQHFSHSLL